MGSNNHRKGKALVAGLVAAATLFGTTGTASAAIGSDYVVGPRGNSTGVYPKGALLYIHDNITGESGAYDQGWGDASIDYAYNIIKAAGYNFGDTDAYQGHERIYRACRGAIKSAIARSNGQSDKARVIGIAATTMPGGSSDGVHDVVWGTNGGDFKNRFNSNWDAVNAPARLVGYDANWVNTVKNEFYTATDAAAAASPTMVQVVCVAVNENEPPSSYDLTVSTQAGGTFNQAGATGDVSDAITTSRGGSQISENVTGSISLHWTGLDGTTRTASKQFTQNNNTTQNVSFGYKDVDAAWKAWPAGSYYYDVTIPKQGKMKNAASHMGAQDANESWKPTTPPPSKKLTNMAGETVAAPNDQIMSGSPYTAHITAQSNASEHFWLYDTIDVTSQKVLIGGADKDDFSKITVTDQNGNTVKADITVDDSQTGKRIVKAHVLNPASGQYTLNVPQSATPTGSDYVIPDDSQACWTGDEYGNTDASHCQTGNSEQVGKITPKPDKVWVLDSNGALKADDPQWTNDKGADNRTFVTGDPIGAVVNGLIPAHLLNPFTSYSITDDWTASAQYIDWNHKDQVKVYVDGKDETANFDITIDTAKHTTTAAAKQPFLAKTAVGTTDRKVKLYLGGIVKQAPNAQHAADQRRLTNKAAETWNNETRPTNEPPVYVRNPKPDKTWSADQGQAAAAEDSAWTNKVNADTHTFVQQDDFGVTVTGLLPKNLARKMSSYELGDDFSKSARNIDLDSASVTVTIDGKDANSLFDVHKQDGKVWITAKQSLLDTTYNQAADRKVRMTIKGAFTKGVLKAGQKVQLTNGDWEKWNQ